MTRMIIYGVDPRLITIDSITDIMSILCINAADIKADGQLITKEQMDEYFSDDYLEAAEIAIDPVNY